VTGPIAVRGRHQGPRVRSEIDYGAAVRAPALLVKSNFEPRCSSAARDAVNADNLSGCRCRPIGISLRNAIDRLAVDIDELVRAWADRVDTVNLGVRILNARPGGRTDPTWPFDQSKVCFAATFCAAGSVSKNRLASATGDSKTHICILLGPGLACCSLKEA
jgi:hypothetical protein